MVGRRIRVFWPDDARYYVGHVSQYNSTKGKHRVVYEDDGEVEVRASGEAWGRMMIGRWG